MIERETIAAAYDAAVDEEYRRLVSTPIREYEFRLATEFIEKYTPPQGTIIDIGSGPGRYAEYCLNKKYQVGIVDISAKSLSAFEKRIKHAPDNLLFNKVSCATTLEWIPDETADTLLLMGPMYHLTDEFDRQAALAHCGRILKSNGHLITVFLSTFPSVQARSDIVHLAQEGYDGQKYRRIPEKEITHVQFHGHQVPQFRCSPAFAKKMLGKCGFKSCRTANIEGIGMHFPKDTLSHYHDESDKTNLFTMLGITGSLPELTGITEQFIIVARRS